MHMRTIKLIIHTLILLVEVIAGTMFFIYISIGVSSASFTEIDLSKLPMNQTILVLGTSEKTLGGKSQNQYFNNRVNAVFELYKAGNVKCILISGDNSEKYYNEPQDMKRALLKKGIPKSIINLDYAGFSTYESVYRAKEIFGVDECIIVSQQFQVERAVWLARGLGLDAKGFFAKDVTKSFGFFTHLREIPARTLAFWDWMYRPEPKFLGEKEFLNCE